MAPGPQHVIWSFGIQCVQRCRDTWRRKDSLFRMVQLLDRYTFFKPDCFSIDRTWNWNLHKKVLIDFFLGFYKVWIPLTNFRHPHLDFKSRIVFFFLNGSQQISNANTTNFPDVNLPLGSGSGFQEPGITSWILAWLVFRASPCFRVNILSMIDYHLVSSVLNILRENYLTRQFWRRIKIFSWAFASRMQASLYSVTLLWSLKDTGTFQAAAIFHLR